MYTQTHNVSVRPGNASKKSKARYEAAVKRQYANPAHFEGIFGAIYNQIYWFWRKIQFWFCYEYNDPQCHGSDTDFGSNYHHTVKSLNDLCSTTNFTANQIKFLYRGFKQHCPTGAVTEMEFKKIYNTYFPHTCTDKYASRVFIMLSGKEKEITFEKLLICLSKLQFGTEEERLEIMFTLIDPVNRGQVNFEEFTEFVHSVYDLSRQLESDSSLKPNNKDKTGQKADLRAKMLFQELDLNNDGWITNEEFQEAMRKREYLTQTLNNMIITELPNFN